MTYAEFKTQMAAAGVRDDDVIDYIEIDPVLWRKSLCGKTQDRGTITT